MRIECPSGLTGEVRGLTVGDTNLFVDPRAARSGETLDTILKKNWIETVDPGPYTLDKDGRIFWPGVLTADRYFAAVMIRVATHGPEFDFRVPCNACRSSIDWSLKLTDLPVKKVSEETLETFTNGNRFSTTVAGPVVYFRLQNGELERKAQRAVRNARDPLTTVLSLQILEVQGQPNKIKWVRDLGLAEGLALRDAFDEVDGGIETEIDVVCDTCGVEASLELPFGQQEFWLPSRQTRRRKCR